MTDVIHSEDGLWIANIGCGITRCALLALEPGSKIWLEVEGETVLFERMADVDNLSQRGLVPVGKTALGWTNARKCSDSIMLKIDFVERPVDIGRRAESIYRGNFDQSGLRLAR